MHLVARRSLLRFQPTLVSNGSVRCRLPLRAARRHYTDPPEEKLLYRGSKYNLFFLRFMCVNGLVCGLYFPYYTINAYYYQDVHINGAPVWGDPRMGMVGVIASSFIMWGLNRFGPRMVRIAYESADGKRLGFNMYNFMGSPGRTIEAAHHNVRISKGKTMSADSLLLDIKGANSPIILDKQADFLQDKKLMNFLLGTLNDESVDDRVVSKEERVSKLKEDYGSRARKNKRYPQAKPDSSEKST